MTSPTESFDRFLGNLAKSVGNQVLADGGTVEDGLAAEGRSRFVLGLDSLGTVSSSSISSASSPQSSRSGTSSRSLPGLMRSGLVAYLPALLVGANAQIQLSLAQGTGEGERSDKTT